MAAHLDYARLGAAYDTFGDFGDEIDGRPNGLPGGVADPNFQGFLRLEYGLWHGQPLPVLVSVVDRLDTAVHGLVQQFPLMQTPANDVSLRTHEILENTLQFELTGEEDEGSHTTLATALANVQGTQLALTAIAPLLQQHDPQLLAAVTAGLQGLPVASPPTTTSARGLLSMGSPRGSGSSWTRRSALCSSSCRSFPICLSCPSNRPRPIAEVQH